MFVGRSIGAKVDHDFENNLVDEPSEGKVEKNVAIEISRRVILLFVETLIMLKAN